MAYLVGMDGRSVGIIHLVCVVVEMMHGHGITLYFTAFTSITRHNVSCPFVVPLHYMVLVLLH